MDRQHYYTPRTDRQRLASSQRQVMSLEQRVKELEEEIVRLTIKSDKDDEMIEQSYQTLDNQREQVPMYMLNTLEVCYNYLEQNDNYSLRDSNPKLTKDLRDVIEFLQQ